MSGIERYTIERELGRGAMGIVHLARDTELDREVAIKELAPPDTAGPEKHAELAERFEREAKTVGSLDSANIVKVYDTFADDGRHYIVMEYLDGRTLDEVLKAGPLPPEAAVGVATQILAALKTAHTAGVIHRDLKPENVFVLGDGLVKVADFGIARTQDGVGLTQAGQVLGTLGYMSPEQVRGQDIDGRTDVFALGVMLYEMLVGQNPFAADQPTTAMYRIAYEEPPAADLVVTNLPAHLGAVIKKATAKDVELRYQSAEEMLVDLEAESAPDVSAIEAAAAARIAPGAQAPVTAASRPRIRLNKKALVSALAAIVLLGGLAGGAYAYMKDKESKDSARAAAIRAEAEVMVDTVAELKGLRVELDKVVVSIRNKADANGTALAAWDTEWQRRQDAYDVRVAEVANHNRREEQKWRDSEELYYDYWFGYTSEYTYDPNYWSDPSYPAEPAKVKVSLAEEDAALLGLTRRIDSLRARLATETAQAQYFAVVYQRTTEAAGLLLAAATETKSLLAGLIVANPDKGDMIDGSRADSIDFQTLETGFKAVDTEVGLYVANYGLDLQQLIADGSASSEATASAK